MTDSIFEPALGSSTVEVLEKMFFISDLGDALPDEETVLPEITARVTFDGTPPGWLLLRVSKAAARSITSDFLGEDEVSDAQAEEMVCELANMICGSVLSRTESDATFRLAAPRIVSPDDWYQDWPSDYGAEPVGTAKHRVALSNGALTIFMKGEAPTCRSNEKSAS